MSVTKPLIGLTSQYNSENSRLTTPQRYMDAISNAGGIPVLLPQIKSNYDISILASRLDGILFTGGDDVHPKLYGEDISPECGEITEQRDDFEIALLNEVLKLNIPVLGICRGIQLINVGMGGSLYQHIDGHSNVKHEIIIVNKDKISVNSYHHQAVKTLAPTLKAAAVDINGLVEAIYMPGHKFFVGVQWHPEIIENDFDNSNSIKLFNLFIKSCN